MSDEKISAMPNAAALTGAELVPVVQGGANVKATSQNIANLAPAPAIIKGTTAASGFSVGDIIVNGAGNLIDAINDIAAGAVLASNGVGAKPVFTTTPNVTSISFSSGTALNNYTENTWTPSDQSGAGLTLTVNKATFTRIGRFIHLVFNITFPPTADANPVTIGGVPIGGAVANEYAIQAAALFTTNVIVYTALSPSSSQLNFLNTALVPYTNAQFSSKQFAGVLTYSR